MIKKSILVLGRRDHAEAMRVAAGLTIFGHEVRLVFMDREVEINDENEKQAELLELADIEPQTTVPGTELECLDPMALADVIGAVDFVVNL